MQPMQAFFNIQCFSFIELFVLEVSWQIPFHPSKKTPKICNFSHDFTRIQLLSFYSTPSWQHMNMTVLQIITYFLLHNVIGQCHISGPVAKTDVMQWQLHWPESCLSSVHDDLAFFGWVGEQRRLLQGPCALWIDIGTPTSSTKAPFWLGKSGYCCCTQSVTK